MEDSLGVVYSVKRLGRILRNNGDFDDPSPVRGTLAVRRDLEDAVGEAVNLVGLSEHGFSFRAASSIPLGERIVAESQACAYEAFEPVEAVVRHCTEDGEGFVIGAEILSPDGEPAAAPSDAQAALVEGVEEAV